MNKIEKVVLTVFLLLVCANLGYLDYRYAVDNFENNRMLRQKSFEVDEQQPFYICGAECQKSIEDRVASEVARLTDSLGNTTLVPSPKTPLPTSVAISEPKVFIMPIAGYGETAGVSWTEVKPSEFYFDLANYPGAKEVRLEAYLLAEHGGSKVYGRLYDVTNNRGVDYSDLSTSDKDYVRIESSAITIWRGNNKYVVQLKSENGTLARIKEAKLRIIY